MRSIRKRKANRNERGIQTKKALLPFMSRLISQLLSMNYLIDKKKTIISNTAQT